MGYTHYWKIKRPIPPKTWARIAGDTRALLLVNSVPLLGDAEIAGDPPIVDAKEIFFNGIGEDGHETFALTPDKIDFEFCKTAQKPYDKLVCAVLIVAARHASQIVVSSDGWRHEWQPALDFVSQVLGEGYAIPQDVEPSPVEA